MIGRWEGGEIRATLDGRRVYHVRKHFGGRRWQFSLATGDVEVALAEYRRWRADPWGYQLAPPPPSAGPVILSVERVGRFLAWSKARGNSPGYVQSQKSALSWWALHLFAHDLRKLWPVDLHGPLQGATALRQRIAAIKVFFHWLRTEEHELLERDATTTLRSPTTRPEQWAKSKVISREAVELVRAKMPERYRDALDVLLGTGWHKTELVRFADGGSVELLPPQRQAEGAAQLLCPRTKSGAPLRTIVSPQVADAARRLLTVEPDHRARNGGRISGDYLNVAISEALAVVNAERAEKHQALFEPFSAGSARHTVATWAIEAGAAPAAVAAFLNHRSMATTMRFYATLAAPPKVPTPR